MRRLKLLSRNCRLLHFRGPHGETVPRLRTVEPFDGFGITPGFVEDHAEQEKELRVCASRLHQRTTKRFSLSVPTGIVGGERRL